MLDCMLFMNIHLNFLNLNYDIMTILQCLHLQGLKLCLGFHLRGLQLYLGAIPMSSRRKYIFIVYWDKQDFWSNLKKFILSAPD